MGPSPSISPGGVDVNPWGLAAGRSSSPRCVPGRFRGGPPCWPCALCGPVCAGDRQETRSRRTSTPSPCRAAVSARRGSDTAVQRPVEGGSLRAARDHNSPSCGDAPRPKSPCRGLCCKKYRPGRGGLRNLPVPRRNGARTEPVRQVPSDGRAVQRGLCANFGPAAPRRGARAVPPPSRRRPRPPGQPGIRLRTPCRLLSSARSSSPELLLNGGP